jgi:hypothetical protein
MIMTLQSLLYLSEAVPYLGEREDRPGATPTTPSDQSADLTDCFKKQVYLLRL